MAQDFPELKSGDTLEPWHLNVIYRELKRWRKMKVIPPLASSGITSTDGIPPVLRFIGQGNSALAITSSSITARAGTTAGTGTATIQDFDGTDFSATVDPADDETVFNFSGTAIDTGKYVMLTFWQDAWFVTAVEC